MLKANFSDFSRLNYYSVTANVFTYKCQEKQLMVHLDWKTVVYTRESYEDKFSSSLLLFPLLSVVYTSPEEKRTQDSL